MPALKSFYITFEKNMDVYQAGQVVRGQVEVELNEDMKMGGIKLLMKGSAQCRWVISTGKTTVVYTGKEVYFEKTVTLWGTGPGVATFGNTPVLPAGKHTYPFQYQLPSAGLPTSFESGYGHVRYFAEAIIDRPWKFDKKTKRAFTVLDMYDLNEVPNAMTPSAAQDSKKLGFWHFASDPIELQVQTNRGAYCPGETVRLSGTLKNGSGIEIKETTVQLRQKATCFATSSHKEICGQKTLSEIKALGCKAKDATDLSSIALPIPAIPPSSQRYCNIIDVEYKIKFIVNIPGLHTNLDVEMPITIGSIPLKSYYPQAPSFPLHPVKQPPPSHESLYPNLGFAGWTYPATTDPSAPPPPYFAVSTEGPVALAEDKEDKYTMGPTEYAPKYAYYDWSKHA
ncbi:arrestin domain-containing protein 3-like [Branchiostoma floridae x Branchiostoma japonicum]